MMTNKVCTNTNLIPNLIMYEVLIANNDYPTI